MWETKRIPAGWILTMISFFSLMAQCDEIPKTAQITPFQFQEIYLREAQEASDKWQYQLRRHWD